MSKKILLIANKFPPPIDGGNMRVYKFAKYLNRHGWEVHVICNAWNVKEQIGAHAKLRDELKGVTFYSVPSRFSNEPVAGTSAVPAGAVTASPSLLRSMYEKLMAYVVPDSQRLLWTARAAKAAARVISDHRIRYVLTSSPPHSTQLVGARLKKLFGNRIEWIADFRDVWSLSPVYALGLARNRQGNAALEKKILRAADKLVFVSEGIRAQTIAAFHIPGIAEKSVVIHNGYDPDDFGAFEASGLLPAGKINFSYVGTMFGPRTYHKLLESIRLFGQTHPGNKAAFNLLGSFDQVIFEKAAGMESVSFIPPAPHARALGFMNESDVLILVLTDDDEGKVAFSGKFFEYLKAGKPILALVPEGEVSVLVDRYNLGIAVNPSDAAGIAAGIALLYNRQVTGETAAAAGREELLQQFNREELCYQLEHLIETEKP